VIKSREKQTFKDKELIEFDYFVATNHPDEIAACLLLSVF